jgi:hypothetical protein
MPGSDNGAAGTGSGDKRIRVESPSLSRHGQQNLEMLLGTICAYVGQADIYPEFQRFAWMIAGKNTEIALWFTGLTRHHVNQVGARLCMFDDDEDDDGSG